MDGLGAGIPVVIISGLTHPTNEFATPCRVINYHACHNCWNDRQRLRSQGFLLVSSPQGTSRQLECTRLITVGHVGPPRDSLIHRFGFLLEIARGQEGLP